MIAGVPGIGISGIFYLVCAAIMPFIEIYRTIKGRGCKIRRKLALKQFGILLGIIAASWTTGLLIGEVVSRIGQNREVSVHHNLIHQENFFRMQPMILSFITMAVIFGGLHLFNRYIDRKSAQFQAG